MSTDTLQTAEQPTVTKAKKSTKAKTASTAEQPKAYKVALDVGNFAIKRINQGDSQALVIRSLYAEIFHGVTPKNHKPDSPIVIWGNDRYHFGSQAFKYPTGCNPVAIGDKTETKNFQRAMLASFTPIESQTNYQVDLRVSVPNPEMNGIGDRLTQELPGFYQFTRNGVPLAVEVTNVIVEREGIPAYRYAQSLDLVPDRGYTLLIDIGGSTWNVMVIDSEGDLVGEPHSYDKQGGIGLAMMIADNSRLRVALGDEPDLAVIMDGITNGSHQYGEKDICWKSWFSDYLDAWYLRNMQFTQARCKAYLSNVTKILFTGGNALLLREKLEGKALTEVITDPTLANCRGMLID